MKDMFKICLDRSYRAARSYTDAIYWNGRCSGRGGHTPTARSNTTGNSAAATTGNATAITSALSTTSTTTSRTAHSTARSTTSFTACSCSCSSTRPATCGGCNSRLSFPDIADNTYSWRDPGSRKCSWPSWSSCAPVDDNRI